MNNFLQKFQNKQLHIVGYGVEGTSTVQFLLDQGIDPSQITIHDSEATKKTPESTTSKLGEEFGRGLDDADVIFRTAGIPLHHEVFTNINNSKITSQVQLFFDHFTGKTLGVTGSKGKSTTTSMIDAMLQHAGYRTVLVGNIGAGRLTDIDREDPDLIALCELSSGQLEGLDLQLDIGVFTNFYPIHHIGRHGSLEKYRDAKLQLVKHSQQLILGSQIVQDCPEIMQVVGHTPFLEYGPQGDFWYSNGVFVTTHGSIVGNDAEMPLLGDHNRENACALFAVCKILAIDYKYAQQTIDSFTGLPHRLENVGVIQGITWINDAIATTPQATMAAIQTIGDDLETIFLGGKDEGYEYDELCEVINTHHTIKTIILFPDTHEIYLRQLDAKQFSITVCHSMHDAVQVAAQHTASGKTALLSCATPSMSLWRSYVAKGNKFKEEVRELKVNS